MGNSVVAIFVRVGLENVEIPFGISSMFYIVTYFTRKFYLPRQLRSKPSCSVFGIPSQNQTPMASYGLF